jgi:hypothetical protein
MLIQQSFDALPRQVVHDRDDKRVGRIPTVLIPPARRVVDQPDTKRVEVRYQNVRLDAVGVDRELR